ncbi:acetyl-CoA synthetase-like protein [Amylostereum chailletii]|nr:acetyl-CoA synthetase-like protein [Amylostereum chailletii]
MAHSSIFFSRQSLPPTPDDLTIPQFFLDASHPSKLPHPPGSPFLIDDVTGRSVTFDEIRARTHALANGLSAKLGFGDGDIACICSPNHIDYPVILYAVHRLCGVVTGANPSYTVGELVHQLQITEARTVFVHVAVLTTVLDACRAVGIPSERVIVLDEAPSEGLFQTVDQLVSQGSQMRSSFVERKLEPGEAKTKLAVLSLSSGTTGPPKAVAISHYSFIVNTLQMYTHNNVIGREIGLPSEKLRFRPGDVATCVLPLFHIYGMLQGLHLMMISGMSLVMMPKFSWPDFLDSVSRHKITHLIVVPPMVVLLCKHPATKNYDLRHIRFVLCAGAPVSGDLLTELSTLLPGADITQGYGMTETATALTVTPAHHRVARPGSVGTLLAGTRAYVLKTNGERARAGEPGELVIHSPANALGYHNNPKETASTFVNGYVHTGDEVIIDAHGEVFVIDRLKELIKVRGFQVAPAELERHLIAHPDVADVCVIGVPDEMSGELPRAYVVLHHQVAERARRDTMELEKIKASLFKHVADAKTRYKWLAGGIEFMDAIPKNPSGKLLRRVLRDKVKAEMAQKTIREEAFKARL